MVIFSLKMVRWPQCTTYTGNHEKAGTTELKLNGETYIIKDGTK